MTVYVLRDPCGLYWRESRHFTSGIVTDWTPARAIATTFPSMTEAEIARIEHDLEYVDVIPVDDEAEADA